MSTLSIEPTYPTFTDSDGSPLDDGYVWIGTAGSATPIANPQTAYWDAGLTQVVTQPVRTRGGYPLNAGAIGRLYVAGDYSILVRNRNGYDLYSATNATERISGVVVTIDASNVTFTQAGANAVQRTALAKMREVVSVKDFGAVGDGVTDDTAAIQYALNTTATEVFFPPGQYRIVDVPQVNIPILTSSVSDRIIHGPGQITADSRVRYALGITGDRTKVHLTFNGNSQIGVALFIESDECEVSGCVFRNLYAPPLSGTARGVDVSFDTNDYSILISNNIFDTIEAVGNTTGGDGNGLSRAISLVARTNITKSSIVANNIINSVIGEEGDCIIILASNEAGTYYDFPVLIANNTITTWTRRAIKTQSNKATIKNNSLRNTYTTDPGNMQHAISIVQGGYHTVDGNVLEHCWYGGQITLVSEVGERWDDIVITNNVIKDVGTETSNALIYISSRGENTVVANNTIICPNANASVSIAVVNALSGFVAGNIIESNTTDEYLFTNSVNLATDVFTKRTDTVGRYHTSSSLDAFGINVFGASQRSLRLYNWDTVVNDGELSSQIQFHQNDANSPDTVMASIRAVAAGSTGSLELAFHTGNFSTPDAERLRISTAGNITPGADNTQDFGSSSLRWNDVYGTILRPGTGTVQWTSGSGTPEGSVTAVVGSLYTRTDGGSSTTLYVKETGTGSTGWVAK